MRFVARRFLSLDIDQHAAEQLAASTPFNVVLAQLHGRLALKRAAIGIAPTDDEAQRRLAIAEVAARLAAPAGEGAEAQDTMIRQAMETFERKRDEEERSNRHARTLDEVARVLMKQGQEARTYRARLDRIYTGARNALHRQVVDPGILEEALTRLDALLLEFLRRGVSGGP